MKVLQKLVRSTFFVNFSSVDSHLEGKGEKETFLLPTSVSTYVRGGRGKISLFM